MAHGYKSSGCMLAKAFQNRAMPRHARAAGRSTQSCTSVVGVQGMSTACGSEEWGPSEFSADSSYSCCNSRFATRASSCRAGENVDSLRQRGGGGGGEVRIKTMTQVRGRRLDTHAMTSTCSWPRALAAACCPKQAGLPQTCVIMHKQHPQPPERTCSGSPNASSSLLPTSFGPDQSSW